MKNKKAKKIAMMTGLAIAGAGAAYLYGTKDGKKKRGEISTWATKAKKEVLNKAKKVNNIKETAYNEIIKNVMDSYSSKKDLKKKVINYLPKELKSGQKDLKTDVKGVAKKPKAKVPKSKMKPKAKVKATVKKAVAKVKKSIKKQFIYFNKTPLVRVFCFLFLKILKIINRTTKIRTALISKFVLMLAKLMLPKISTVIRR